MAPAGRFPYLIFYTVGEDEIRIIRVLHGARLRAASAVARRLRVGLE